MFDTKQSRQKNCSEGLTACAEPTGANLLPWDPTTWNDVNAQFRYDLFTVRAK